MPERESAPIYFLWKWKWSQIVNYFLSGMRYIENEELVHRDLAARNVLLDRNGVAKVKTKFWNDLFIHLIFLYLGATFKICNSWAYLGIFCLQVADFGLSKSKGEATDNDAFPILWSPPEVTTLNQFIWIECELGWRLIKDVLGSQQKGFQFQVWCLVKSKDSIDCHLYNCAKDKLPGPLASPCGRSSPLVRSPTTGWNTTISRTSSKERRE